jgi:uracil-DNA glycosylase family 4
MESPYTEGPLDAKIVFVGEAAGEVEERKKAPFVGPAGRALNELLASAGVNRYECRLENIFQFHPEGNDLSPYIKFNTKGVCTYESEIYLAQKAALKERLEKTSANVIVPLGNIAQYTLCGRDKISPGAITRTRGSIYPSTLVDRKCVPTIHPSATLHFGQGTKFNEFNRKKSVDPYCYRYWIVTDVMRAMEQSSFPEIRLLDRHLILEPSFEDVRQFIEHARSCPLVAFDIECTMGSSSEVTHVGLATSPTVGISIPLSSGMQDYWVPDQEAAVWQLITSLLEDQNVMKVAHNAVFDVSFLHYRHGIVTAPVEDTMIAAAILYPDFPAALYFATSIYCNGEPYYKDEYKQWASNPFGSELRFREYNAKDAAVLLEIFPKQVEELKKCNNFSTYERQHRLIHPLVYMMNKGQLMDIGRLEGLRKDSEIDIAETLAKWNTLTGGEINPDSTKQVQSYFYIDLKHRPYTKKGSITCDEKALRRMAAQAWEGREAADTLLDYRKSTKLKRTYFDMTFDKDNRLRCSYNPVGTSQGRISSSQNIFGSGSNLQNQPPEMHSLMVPDPGYILVSQDFAQAENRVVAYIANEGKMIWAFEKGIDIHVQTGALLRGVPLDKVTPEIRTEGKIANHGLNYDLGYKSFAIYYGLTEPEAKKIVDTYHIIYPGIREWHRATKEELVRNHNTLVNCFGRRRAFRGRWGHEMFKLAYNYVPQSTIGDLTNLALIFMYERQDLFPEVIILNNIHDSIRYEIPIHIGPERIVEIVKRSKAEMELPIEWKGRSFNVPVDTKLGFSFNEKDMMEWKHKMVDEADDSHLVEELERYIEKVF